MNSKRDRLLLLGVLTIATLFRLWHLQTNPPGLHADEAMVGYTAYSLLATGADLAGNRVLVGFADTNIGGTFPSLLSWLLVPFVWFLGLEPYVVRLPSALLGVLTVWLVYILTRKLLGKGKVAILAAFLAAVNPWAIQISRQGLLESLSLTLVTAGIVLFVSAKKNIRMYSAAFVCFALSLYAYDAPRVFVPVMICALIWFCWHDIRAIRIPFLRASLLFLVVLATVIYRIFFVGVIGDYIRSSIFDINHISAGAANAQTLTTAPQWVSRIFHNKATVAAETFLTSYVSIFSLDWFFINGSSNLQRAIGNHGQYYIFELPLFFIGIWYAFLHTPKVALLLLSWLLLGALPGGLSTGNFVYRSSLLLPAPMIFSAIGLAEVSTWTYRLRHHMRGIAQVCIGGVVAASILSYAFTYFFDYPVYASEWWAAQQNDAVRYVIANKGAYDHVYIHGGPDWMTMYAFWTRMDPAIFHQQFTQGKNEAHGKRYTLGTMQFSLIDQAVLASPSATGLFPPKSLLIVPGKRDVFANDVPITEFYGPQPPSAVFKAIEVR